MKLDRDNIKKIVLILFVAIIIFYGINNFGIVLGLFEKAVNLCFPFILGGAIAFILNVPMGKIEKLLFKKVKNEKLKRAGRPIALAITILLVIAAVAGAILIVVPEIGATVKNLISQIPEGWDRFVKWIEGTPLNGTFIDKYEKEIEEIWNNMSDTVISALKSGAMGALNTGIGVVSGVVSGIANFLIAFVFAIYVLLQKEKLQSQITRILRAVIKEERVEKFLKLSSLTNSTFASFLTGQCLEACILGTMFFIVMSILKLPYALLIGILIGFTALIPIVGAFIGCVVGAFLIVIVSPVKALVFVIVFLILQQLEGNLIYPHVVGNSVGLPSMWVLVAVTVGSKIMGITGMIIFIPIFSVAYAMLREYVQDREQEKRMIKAEEAEKNQLHRDMRAGDKEKDEFIDN